MEIFNSKLIMINQYPKISIITACYNMENYIEQTIRSIIDQNYPNLEYIIIDGGSSDNTINIVKKYLHKIDLLISEPDEGQYYAIRKGIDRATGDIIAWLNADDSYFPWTLRVVGKVFQNYNIKWLCGLPSFLDEEGLLTKIYNNPSAKPCHAIRNGWFRKNGYGFLQQESMFWRKELWEKSGGLDLKYNLAADYKLWTKFATQAELWTINLPLASFRLRKNSRSKISEKEYLNEIEKIIVEYKPLPLFPRIFGSNLYFHFIYRLFVWKKTPLIYYHQNSQQWDYKYKYRPLSTISLSALLLEK